MTTGKVKTLYSDKEKTEALFPRTKVNAISDNDGMGLDAILESVVYIDTNVIQSTTVPVNADTLGGVRADEYATQAFVTNKIAEVQLGGSDNGVDLSGYATKDDLNSIRASLAEIKAYLGI